MAFELLITGLDESGADFQVVDVAIDSLTDSPTGTLRWKSLLGGLRIWKSFTRRIWRSSGVYLIIASSRYGFIRDAYIIWLSFFLMRHIVLHFHGGGYTDFYHSQSRLFKRVIRSTLSKADTIIVLGELLRDQFVFLPDADTKIKVIPNGLPRSLQVKDITPKPLSADSPIRLLYLSNMTKSKGYLDVLKACQILHHQRRIPVRCDFCGEFYRIVAEDGNLDSEQLKKEFYKLRQEWMIQDIVDYHGIVRGKAKQKLLAEAHVFILPTSYPWEGQPISIIEALAYATPVISTQYKGIPEQVIEGFNGFFVKPGAPEQIADMVEFLWRNPDSYREMSKNAYSYYLEHFTSDAHLERLIPLVIGE